MVSTTSKKDFRHVRKATVLKDSSGDILKIGGYAPDKKNASTPKFSSSRFSASNLPEIVDLRSFMTPVENQQNSNSCTANAMAGAYEYLENRFVGKAKDVSRLFIYYNARELDNDTNKDDGAHLSNCVKVVRKYGACSERTWPFDLTQILNKPSQKAYQEATKFRIQDAASVAIDLDTMRSCLAEGYPFSFGLQLFSSFNKAGGNGGLVPMPDIDNEQHDGGHAMLCVGYSEPDQVFIVRNSWGDEWGEDGYCYIPYAYMTNPDLSHDCWVIRQVNDRSVDLSQNITQSAQSLFDPRKAEIASAIRVPGATHTPSGIPLYDEYYTYTYEEQCIYLEDSDEYVSISDVEDLESLYFMEYDEEYEDDYSEEWYEDNEYLSEEITETGDEETTEDAEYSSEEEDEEVEDSYEDDDEEDDEDEEEVEDSYEEDEEDEEDEDDESEDEEEVEDSYEDDESEDEDEEEVEDEEDDSEDEESEDEESEDEEDDSEEEVEDEEDDSEDEGEDYEDEGDEE